MKRRAIMLLMTGILAAQSLLLAACGASDAGSGQSNTEAAEPDAEGQGTVMETASQQDTDAAGDEDAAQMITVTDQGESADAVAQYEDGVNGFAFRFTKEILSQKAEGENMIVSPYSVWLPLAALANGTEEAVREQLLCALGSSGTDLDSLNETVKNDLRALRQEEQVAWMKENGQEDYEGPLKIANALFVDQNARVQQEFEDIFSESYDGTLFSVDFADASAVEEVNAWAAQQTEGKIDQVVEAFDPQTVAAIANAIYYSDGWAKEFPAENTHNDIFHGSEEDEDVSFMYHEFTGMPYYEDDTMQAVSLETSTGGRLTILLPKEGQNAEEILAGMDAEAFAMLMDAEESTVQLTLPRFHVESDVFSVKEALEALNVPLMSGENPPLDQVVEGELLYISQAVQKAMIEVDEEGMTAAAVTVMALERTSLIAEQEPVEVICDRPFAFILSAYASEEQQVLFTGVVNRIGA